MDLDRYIAQNQPSWLRLEHLAGRARRGARRLSAAELDELIELYQRTSAHLAHVRTRYDDPELNSRLSYVLGTARGSIYRRRAKPAAAITRFFTRTFPAAVWICRRQIAVAAFLLLAPALALGIWLGTGDSARDALVDTETQQLLAEGDFADYYSSDAAAAFQASITTNNIQVSVLAFASGIFLGLPTAWLLVVNGANLGVSGAVMHAHGQGAEFWGLIVPHGLLELTAIAVAAGAGLRLGWAVIAPGDRSRRSALAEEGLRAVVILCGTVLCFVVAGFIEAWVTPSDLPTWARVAVGVTVEGVFLAYVVGVGGNAVRAGYAGHLGESSPSTTAVGQPAASPTTSHLTTSPST